MIKKISKTLQGYKVRLNNGSIFYTKDISIISNLNNATLNYYIK